MLAEIGRERSGLRQERTLISGQTTAVVLPRDGALVARFRVGETDVFLPDQLFAAGGREKRRGGCPLLFPNAGPLTEPTDLFALPQHGFGRDLPWVQIANSLEATVLWLEASEASRKQFPHDFSVMLTVEASEGALSYGMVVVNRSDQTPMPIAPGFHPYFYVPVAKKPDISTNIPGFDPRGYDWENPIEFPGQEVIEVQIPESGRVVMRPSSYLETIVIWSESDRDFVCIEPWTGGRNALLHPEERINVPPKGEVNLSLDIQFHPE